MWFNLSRFNKLQIRILKHTDSASLQILLWGHHLMEMARFLFTEAQMPELRPNLLRWVVKIYTAAQEDINIKEGIKEPVRPNAGLSSTNRYWMAVTLMWDVLDTPSQVVWILITTITQMLQWALLMIRWFSSGEKRFIENPNDGKMEKHESSFLFL